MAKKNLGVFLEFFSHRILEIAIPVIVTLVCDAFLARFLEGRTGTLSLDRSFSQTLNPTDSGVSTEWAIYIALILIGMITIVTAIILVCYYYGCVKAIIVWMVVAVTLLLTLYIYIAFKDVPKLLGVPFDWITVVLFFLNVTVTGNMAVFWRAPLIYTQVVLVIISILIAIVFLSLPDWTVWILLVILIIYDCCVVLCPHGLLNVIIKKSEERGDALPALVYSSAAWISSVYHPSNEYENGDEGIDDENDDDDDDDDEGENEDGDSQKYDAYGQIGGEGENENEDGQNESEVEDSDDKRGDGKEEEEKNEDIPLDTKESDEENDNQHPNNNFDQENPENATKETEKNTENNTGKDDQKLNGKLENVEKEGKKTKKKKEKSKKKKKVGPQKSDQMNEPLLPNDPKKKNKKGESSSDGTIATVKTAVLSDFEEEEESCSDNEKKLTNAEKTARKKKRRFETDDEEGIKLGLGDFVFYGILVTRAARVGWDITILCIFAVVLGLSITLIFLAWLERPLPALPFSLILGILFYIIGIYTFRPFYQNLRSEILIF